jgi:hypothetical protein
MSAPKSTPHPALPDALPTLETADLAMVTGGAGLDMSSMMPIMMMMMQKRKASAQQQQQMQMAMMAGPPPGAQPPAAPQPVLPRIFVNGVEQHFDPSSGGTLSTTTET